MLNLKKCVVLVESRRPARPEEIKNSFWQEGIKYLYVRIKKHCFQRGRFRAKLIAPLMLATSMGKPVNFTHPRRLTNFEYPKDMALTQDRLLRPFSILMFMFPGM